MCEEVKAREQETAATPGHGPADGADTETGPGDAGDRERCGQEEGKGVYQLCVRECTGIPELSKHLLSIIVAQKVLPRARL